MFVPGGDPPNVGERVTVEVVFQGGPRVLLHGVVLWRRTTGDARARPGAGVGIDGAEQSKIRCLLGYVRGGRLDVRERRRRAATTAPARCRRRRRGNTRKATTAASAAAATSATSRRRRAGAPSCTSS